MANTTVHERLFKNGIRHDIFLPNVVDDSYPVFLSPFDFFLSLFVLKVDLEKGHDQQIAAHPLFAAAQSVNFRDF